MVNVLISNHKMTTAHLNNIEMDFTNTERLGQVKVRLIDASPIKDYSVKEFFYHVRGVILEAHPGLGDAMHSIIMKNNGISMVLTFDNDFTKIPGLTVFHPDNVLDELFE